MAQLVDLVGDGGALLLARPGRIRCRVVLAVGEILCAAFVSNIVRQEPYTGWNIARSGRFLRYYEEIYFN